MYFITNESLATSRIDDRLRGASKLTTPVRRRGRLAVVIARLAAVLSYRRLRTEARIA